jgi:hypothetical protein
MHTADVAGQIGDERPELAGEHTRRPVIIFLVLVLVHDPIAVLVALLIFIV